MDRLQLKRRMAELLGFVVTERENDAVLERFHEPLPELSKPRVRAVRPATREEVALFLRLMGFVARMEDVVLENNGLREQNNALQGRLAVSSNEIDAKDVQLTSALAIVDEQQSTMGRLHEDVRRLQVHSDSQRETIEHLKDENDGLRTRLQELESEAEANTKPSAARSKR